MCGRFALVDEPDELAALFNVPSPSVIANTNVSPGQQVLVLLRDEQSRQPMFQPVLWGLVPFWAKDSKRPFINARSESAAEKPSFRAAYRHHRCLVPASWFYEWLRQGKSKLPHRFARADAKQMALGGVWSDWQDGTRHMRTMAILTTAANADLEPIHDRMPVIVPPEGWQSWLDPQVQHPKELVHLTHPCANGMLRVEQIAAVG